MGIPSSEFLAGYDSQSRYLYYLAVNALIYEQYGSGKTWVVVDRFVASTHAMHANARGSIAKKVENADFACRGLNIYLEVDELERVRRLHGRGQPMDPLSSALNPTQPFGTELMYASFIAWIEIVQTTGLSVGEVASEICSRAVVRFNSAEAK